MIVLHTIWTDGSLHLWGEQSLETTGHVSAHVRTNELSAPLLIFAIGEDILRRSIGDVYDSLLVTGAARSELTLRLPHRDGQPVPSWSAPTAEPEPGEPTELLLLPCRVPTLAFSPADAVDLLTSAPGFAAGDLRAGASLGYWSKVAALVLELLAKQRFVPAVHHAGPDVHRDRYLGYWRVVVDDEETSKRLTSLIASMPPLCCSMVREGGPVQASALIENFLWTTVDALVRRCLEGNELAHAVHDRSEGPCPQQMRWLRSLVCADAGLTGTSEERHEVYQTVRGWLSKLELLPNGRACRTCFRLHSPPTAGGLSVRGSEPAFGGWQLTLHLQTTQEPALIVDATKLLDDDTGGDPAILKRPFDNGLEQLRTDVAQAARHFHPLAPCADRNGPVQCQLSLQEAYSFLRDAAPILELEGFGVWVPQWWCEDRPRLRMWLDLRPSGPHSPVGTSALGLDAVVDYDWRVAVGDEEMSLDNMAQLAVAKEPLVRVRGQWTEVQPSEVRTALSFLKRNRGGRMSVYEALRRCYIADDLETGLPVAGLRAHGWIDNLLGVTEIHEAIEHVTPPAGFVGTLRPYQLRGLEWLSFLTNLRLGACLADDMGLGKTIQLIALWLHEREVGLSPGPTLLVVPMSLVGNWQREIERFAPSLKVMVHHGTERLTGREFIEEVAKHDVVISTYGLIHRDLQHLAEVEWYRIALDEAQNIKNPAAKQAVAVRSLRAVHRVALTGTPVENRLSELWSILDFLNPGYLSGATEFRRRFAVPIERYHDTDRAERLRHLIRPFVLRRLKNDPKVQIDLPEKMEMKVYCNLIREQAALYQAVVDDMLGQINHADGIQRRGLILATLVKLKQICNHPVQFMGHRFSTGKADCSLPHRSGKCDRLTEMIEEVLAEGDRALIFTQFRQMGDLLQRLLQESFDREVLFLHGGTTRKNRDTIVERFQSESEDTPLLILSLKAGGYGLNLTAASHVFHFDRWWNPAVEDQATDRAYRIGQDKRVQVHKFVCIGTLEERIDGMLEQKRQLAKNILGAGEEWLTELSTEKLREVFELSQEAVAEE